MDKLSKDDVFLLTETFFKIAQEMSPDQVKYYGRNPDKLEELLLSNQISIIGKPVGSIVIPEQESVGDAIDILTHAPFRKASMSMDIGCRVNKKVPASPQRTATAFPIHCYLSHDEVIDQFGGFETLDNVTFTLNQIKYIADQQRYTNKKGLLVQGHSNHFLINGRNGQKEFLTLYWYKPHTMGSPKERGSWGYYFSGNISHQKHNGNLLNGRIFILE